MQHIVTHRVEINLNIEYILTEPDQKRNVEVIGLSEVHGTRKNMKRLLLKKDMKNFEVRFFLLKDGIF